MAALRKVELHWHVDGLATPELLRRLEARGVPQPIPVSRLEEHWPVQSRQDWMENYGSIVGPQVLNRAQSLLEMLKEYAAGLVAQRVYYAEIMLSSFTMQASSTSDQTELFRLFHDAAAELGRAGPQLELLVALGRRKNLDVFQRQSERVRAAAREGLICGVAIAGDEQAVSIRELRPFLEEFREAGLKIEIHAGEFGDPAAVWDALEWGSPDRIGHGLGVFADPVLLEHVRRHRVHLEMCPTSNVVLGKVGSVKEHPIGRAVQEGLNVSVRGRARRLTTG